MLKINNLHVHYGGIHALRGISLEVPKNKIITLIGANGAGEEYHLEVYLRLGSKTDGTIVFEGEDITSLKTTEIVKRGVTLVPEGRHVFPDLTVLENLKLGAYLRTDKSEINKDINRVYELFPRLKERKDQLAGTLSGGEQQMLAIGRALMSRPRLLMMDEPSLGLAPLIVQDVFKIIQQIHNEGMTILLIEQNASAALQIADYGYVLETGSIVLEGTGKELLNNQEVKKAYLGQS